jgi:hypothetical protein
VEALFVQWGSGGTQAPFGAQPSGFPLTVDLTGVPVHGAVVDGPGGITDLASNPRIVLGSSAAGSGVPRGPFVIRQGTTATTYDGDKTADWLTSVTSRTGSGAKVERLSASGRFDTGASPQTFTVQAMTAFLAQ